MTDVARVEVIAPPLISRLVGRRLGPNANATYARLCMGYAVAKVLQHGKLDLTDFRGDALFDPDTHALASRVETRSDDNPDPNALAPQTVVVHLKDGTALRWQCATMLANPARQLTREQHLIKFHRCCMFAADALAPSASERLVEVVDRLEEAEDVHVLTDLLSSPRA
jgi:aconitate decarboxylase